MHTELADKANTGRRDANLLGAWSLAVADAVREATETSSGYGGAVPAALVTLEAYPGRRLEDLRVALDLSQPGTVRLVDRMQAEGWVRRGAGDGRSLAVELTAAGRRRARRLLAERDHALATLLAPLTGAERRRLEQLLEKLLRPRAAAGLDPELMCRLCERAVCARCPVARGAREGRADADRA